jgi:pimeloyl-ACP methyl ester carboxylesterase
MIKDIMNVNGYELEYTISGTEHQNTIVFAHGLGGNVEQWAEQIPYFSKHYRVITFSLQGHGGSSRPKGEEHYTISQYADTAIALLEKLNVHNCIWVGNSMGGVVGYDVINKRPTMVNMLITNGTTPKLVLPPSQIKMVRFFDRFLLKLMKLDGYIRFAVKNTTVNVAVQDKLYDVMIQTSRDAIVASHVALSNYDYLDTIENTNIPIFIIQTPYDKGINKYLAKLDNFFNKNQHVKYLKVDNAGHIVNMESPEKYNESVERIIK